MTKVLLAFAIVLSSSAQAAPRCESSLLTSEHHEIASLLVGGIERGWLTPDQADRFLNGGPNPFSSDSDQLAFRKAVERSSGWSPNEVRDLLALKYSELKFEKQEQARADTLDNIYPYPIAKFDFPVHHHPAQVVTTESGKAELLLSTDRGMVRIDPLDPKASELLRLDAEPGLPPHLFMWKGRPLLFNSDLTDVIDVQKPKRRVRSLRTHLRVSYGLNRRFLLIGDEEPMTVRLMIFSMVGGIKTTATFISMTGEERIIAHEFNRLYPTDLQIAALKDKHWLLSPARERGEFVLNMLEIRPDRESEKRKIRLPLTGKISIVATTGSLALLHRKPKNQPDELIAVDLDSGSPRSKAALNGEPMHLTHADIDGRVLFFGAVRGQGIFQFDTGTGELSWLIRSPRVSAVSPYRVNGRHQLLWSDGNTRSVNVFDLESQSDVSVNGDLSSGVGLTSLTPFESEGRPYVFAIDRHGLGITFKLGQ